MISALIGHTGFVGGNLLRQRSFEGQFNSKNIESIAGQEFELVVCAGAPAEKWKANKDPEADRASLKRLTDALAQVRTKRFILISTVDVYPDPNNVDEESKVEWSLGSAYGRHRRQLEEFCRERFDALVVRLPGLFGRGLKKNALYDLLHDNQVEKIHADAQFQFYWLEHLWGDLQVALRNQLKVLNVATEPLTMAQVAKEAFGLDFENRPIGSPARYDMRSRHAELFGGQGGYLYSRDSILKQLKIFVHEETRGL